MRKHRVLTGILMAAFLTLLCCGGHAQSDEQMFFDANRYYAAGRFEEAAAAYEDLAVRGVASGPLFYNLGNAYLKKGDFEKALESGTLQEDSAESPTSEQMKLAASHLFDIAAGTKDWEMAEQVTKIALTGRGSGSHLKN